MKVGVFSKCATVFIMMCITSFSAFAGLLDNDDCLYNGKKHDASVRYDSSGVSKFKGKVVCVDPDTKKIYSELHMSKGLKNGIEREFERDSGKLRLVTNFINDLIDGVQTKYDTKTGKIWLENSYKKGNLSGVHKEYYEETGKLRRIFYTDENDNDNTSITFTKSGKLTQLSCGSVSVVPDDKVWCGRSGKEGRVKLYFHDDDKLSIDGGYKNGKQNGEWISFHGKGHAVEKTVYADGKMVSEVELDATGKEKYKQTVGAEKGSREVQSFFANTTLIEVKSSWKDGMKVAEVQYYQNGKMKYESKIEGGLHNVKRYYDSGTLQSIGTYTGNCESYYWCTPQGKSLSYQRTGELVDEENWNQGKREGTQKSYNDLGKIAIEEFYEKGTRKWSIEQWKSKDPRIKREFAGDGSILKQTVLPSVNQDGNTLI